MFPILLLLACFTCCSGSGSAEHRTRPPVNRPYLAPCMKHLENLQPTEAPPATATATAIAIATLACVCAPEDSNWGWCVSFLFPASRVHSPLKTQDSQAQAQASPSQTQTPANANARCPVCAACVRPPMRRPRPARGVCQAPSVLVLGRRSSRPERLGPAGRASGGVRDQGFRGCLASSLSSLLGMILISK